MFYLVMKKLQKMISKKIERLLKNPYARLIRLDKPIPIMLCLFPGLWSILLSNASFLYMIYFSIIAILGAFLVRSIGCIINDIFDIKYDSQVERTKFRPLAAKELSINEAIKFLGILLIFLCLILLTLNKKVIIASAIFSILIIIYPLFKRFTFYPQVFLGFAFNAAAIIAWLMVQENLTYTPVIIYAAAIFWIIGYDTIYAFQDINDDVKIGVKSLAMIVKDKAFVFLWSVYQISLVLLVLAGIGAKMGIAYYILLAIAGYQLYWQVATLEIEDPQDCGYKFRSNIIAGALITLGALLGNIKIFVI